MESRAITNAQITASSEVNHKHAASNARLNFQEILHEAAGAWVADGSDDNPWLQVDLGAQYTKVTRVATQGRNSSQYSQWVTKYKLQYCDKNEEFQYYREPGQDADEVKSLKIQWQVNIRSSYLLFFFSIIHDSFRKEYFGLMRFRRICQ